MPNSRTKPVLRLVCVLFLIVCAITLLLVSFRNVFLSPNLEKSVTGSISMDSCGILMFPMIKSDVVGPMGSFGLTSSNLSNSSPMLRSISQNLPLSSTTLLCSSRPDLAPTISSSAIGKIGTGKTLIIFFVCIVLLMVGLILCLTIIVAKCLVLLKFFVISSCYPSMNDPSKSFSLVVPMSMRDSMRRIETKCTKLLFGLQKHVL